MYTRVTDPRNRVRETKQNSDRGCQQPVPSSSRRTSTRQYISISISIFIYLYMHKMVFIYCLPPPLPGHGLTRCWVHSRILRRLGAPPDTGLRHPVSRCAPRVPVSRCLLFVCASCSFLYLCFSWACSRRVVLNASPRPRLPRRYLRGSPPVAFAARGSGARDCARGRLRALRTCVRVCLDAAVTACDVQPPLHVICTCVLCACVAID